MGLSEIAGYSWCENKLSCYFHSLTGCNKTPFLFGRGKRWVSFLAVTGYFVKMNSLPEKPPTDYLCTIERFITVLYDCMTALTKVAFLPAQFKGHISRLMC